MNTCKIYTLEHPLTGEIRYVGKTEESLPTRLTDVLCGLRKSNHGRRFKYISL